MEKNLRPARKPAVGCLLLLALLTLVVSASARDDSEKLYKEMCESCHAADGKGDTAAGQATGARDFGSAQVQKQTDAQLITIIAKGKNEMPAYAKKLTDQQIKDLAAYCRALGKKK